MSKFSEMLEVKTEFSPKELLWFGPLFALFTGVIASILIWRFQWPNTALAICGIAALLIAFYYLVPTMQVRIYRGWLFSGRANRLDDFSRLVGSDLLSDTDTPRPTSAFVRT